MRISVITATFNSAETIRDSVASVLGQTYKDVEYIVVDGGSKDGTLDIIGKHLGAVSKFVSEPDAGMYFALNKGITLATGDVIAFLHADDIFASDGILQKVADTFAASGADAVYGDLAYVKHDGAVLRYWKAGEYTRDSFLSGWMPPHPALFLKRNIYNEHGVFNTEYKIAADYELIVRFLCRFNIRAVYLPELVVKMRVGGISNRSLANIINKSLEDYRIIKKYRLGGIRTLLVKNLSKLPQFFKEPA